MTNPTEHLPPTNRGGHVDDAFVIWPAMGAPARSYAHFAEVLAETTACPVFVAELRGQGCDKERAATRQNDYGIHDILVQDFSHDIASILQQHPSARIHAVGHSFGGTLALLYAARRNSPPVRSVTTIATSLAYWRGFGTKSPFILAGTVSIYALASMLGWFPGKALRYGGTQPKTLMREWAKTGWTGRLSVNGEEVDLRQIEVPVTLIRLERDSLSPPAAVWNLATQLPAARQIQIEGPAATHFGWLRDAGLARDLAEQVEAVRSEVSG